MTVRVSHARAQVSFEFSEDEEPIKLESATLANQVHSGKAIKPRMAQAEWVRNPDGSFRLHSVTVWGNVIKANGHPGLTDTRRDAYTYVSGTGDREWIGGTPDQLIVAVVNNAPGQLGVNGNI